MFGNGEFVRVYFDPHTFCVGEIHICPVFWRSEVDLFQIQGRYCYSIILELQIQRNGERMQLKWPAELNGTCFGKPDYLCRF